MSRVRAALVLLVVLLVTSGCFMGRLVQGPTPSPLPTPGPIATLLPSSAPTLPPRVTPAPTATPAPTPEPTATPEPSPTARPPLAIRILKPGGRADATAPDVDVARLVRGSTDFALDLLDRVVRTSDEPNVVLGPSSISAAFALLHAGARGDTATQIEDALRFDLPPFRLNAAQNALDQALLSRQNRKVTLSIVNQLFGQAGYPFRDAFLGIATRQFGAPLASVDFTRKAKAVTNLINAWIADHTNGRVTDMIPPNQLNATTRLVLVNATYLKAEWAVKFEKFFTQPRPFFRPDGTTVKVPTMYQAADFGAAFANDYTAVELPYVGDDLAMLLVMPDDVTTFLRDLDADGLQAIVDSLKTTFKVQGYTFGTVDVYLPRFSTRTSVALKPLLQKMGLRAVWTPDAADLTGIADPAETGEGPLYASSATHQAWVKVTEKGTEAAAVTVIDQGTGGGVDVPPPTVRLDHPFLWFIRDRVTGAVLFAGLVTDPSATAE